MRIAFVSTMEGAPWGGSEVLWSQAAGVLAMRGHQVFASVKLWDPTPVAIKSLVKNGVQVHFRGRRYLSSIGVSSFSIMKWRRQRWARQWWLKRVSPDLVCVSDGGICFGSSFIHDCQNLQIPYCTLGQANFESWWPSDHVSQELRSIFSGSRKCFFVSHANRELFEKQIGLRLENAEVVWNPFAVPRNSNPPWPARNGSEESFSLACVGRLEPAAKGQDLVLEVLSLPKWQDRRLCVTFFGDGPAKECLERLAVRLGVQNRVRFAGHVANVVDLWKDHHALILPSRYEGLPLAVVEAMLCQRPVIATAVAGTPEVVTDGETGFLAAAPTVSLLDQAMEHAWQYRNQWMQMGIAAGESIRMKVPTNPAEDFADRLEREGLRQ